MLAKAHRSRIDLIEIMERWARYRHGREDGGTGWPKQVMLGKLLDGMPGTDCPRCKDALTGASVGFIHIDAEGLAKQKVTCPVCSGARQVKIDYSPSKANPMLISGNGNRYGWNDDPLSQRIDWLVCMVIDDDERIVVMAEFTQNGNRNRKIARIRITHSVFNDLLDSALGKIAKNLDFP
jgi:hypothetical protein